MRKSPKFSPEVVERAVRIVFAVKDRYPSQWAAIESIAGKIAYFGERDRRFRERDRFERSVLSCVGWIVGSGCLKGRFQDRSATPGLLD